MALELPDQWLLQLTSAVTARIEGLERWVTAEGLASWLGCTVDHVYNLRERGLPGRRLLDESGTRSKKLYFNLGEVSAWFEASTC